MMTVDAVTTVLAQISPGDGGGQGEDFGKSSPVGLFLLIAFAVAVVLLVRSMTKHLKKLPTSFDQDKATAAAPARVKRAEAKAAEESADDPEEATVAADKSTDGTREASVEDAAGGKSKPAD